MKFIVSGKVLSSDNNPVQGVKVEVYDDDLFLDDYLGSSITDNSGTYSVEFEETSFRNFFDRESKPDIYLNVKSTEGKTIYTSSVTHDANSPLEINIKLIDINPGVPPRRICSENLPMYCSKERMEGLFKKRSLPLKFLENSGKRKIDVKNRMIYDDSHWKGFYPIDNLFPPYIFQGGFYKKFQTKDGIIKGVTTAFDEIVAAKNLPKEVEAGSPEKGIILEYTEPQYRLFHDHLKIMNKDVVIGKAYVGIYPNGVQLLTFAMTRKYPFDFMTVRDFLELFDKYGKLPEKEKVLGYWEGRMVSNTSLTPTVFRFKYGLDKDGKVTCHYNFMHLLRGDSRIEFTEKQMLMFDFTNFHDEIRMVDDNLMVGKYCPEEQEILNILGDRSLGLLHFEKSDKGTKPCIYYSINRVQK